MKKYIKIIALAALIYILLSFSIRPLFACKCTCGENIINPSHVLNDSTAVFIGKVINIPEKLTATEDVEGEVTFQVSRIWEGTPNKRIVVHVRYGCCGSHVFMINREYLVYADGTDNKLYESVCSQTKLLSEASKDLQSLGVGKIPTIEPVNSFNSAIIGGVMAVVTSVVLFYFLRNKRSNNSN